MWAEEISSKKSSQHVNMLSHHKFLQRFLQNIDDDRELKIFFTTFFSSLWRINFLIWDFSWRSILEIVHSRLDSSNVNRRHVSRETISSTNPEEHFPASPPELAILKTSEDKKTTCQNTLILWWRRWQNFKTTSRRRRTKSRRRLKRSLWEKVGFWRLVRRSYWVLGPGSWRERVYVIRSINSTVIYVKSRERHIEFFDILQHLFPLRLKRWWNNVTLMCIWRLLTARRLDKLLKDKYLRIILWLLPSLSDTISSMRSLGLLVLLPPLMMSCRSHSALSCVKKLLRWTSLQLCPWFSILISFYEAHHIPFKKVEKHRHHKL